MKIPIFLSQPTPMDCKQKCFLDNFSKFLNDEGLCPLTLGVTNYDRSAPLKGIRRIMLESDGLLALALKRTHIEKGAVYRKCDKKVIDDCWLTSPYCQIEPAMAFQLGLPVLILRDKDVLDEGLLEKGVIGDYMPVINMDMKEESCNYFKSEEFMTIFKQWEADVRTVAKNKGNPPKLY